MADLDLVIRARRVVTPAGEVDRQVGVKDGRVVAIEPPEAGPHRRRDRRPRRRRGAAAGRRRHPRARQRPRPHRVGGLHHRDPRGSGRRRDHDRGHAAQQHPADRRPRRARGRSARPPSGRRTSTSASGAAPYPATSRTCVRCTRRASSASSASCSPSGVDEFPPLDDDELAARHARDRRLRRPAHRARRGRRTPSTRPRRPRPPATTDFLASRPRDRRGPRRRPRPRPRPAHAAAACTSSTSPAPTPCRPSRRAQGRRRAGSPPRPARTTCTFAADEIPDGATQYKCCPPIRERDNREQLWQGLARRHARPGRLRPLAVARADLKCLDTGDFGDGLGRHLVPAAGPARRLDRRATSRPRPRRRRPLDVRGAGPPGRAASQGPRSRSGTTPTSSSSPPTRRSPWTPPGSTTATPSRRTHGRTLVGAVRSTWLRGRRIDIDAEPRGRLLTRGVA